jgi:hypothetical protein
VRLRAQAGRLGYRHFLEPPKQWHRGAGLRQDVHLCDLASDPDVDEEATSLRRLDKESQKRSVGV